MKFNFNTPLVKTYAAVIGVIILITVPLSMMEETPNSPVSPVTTEKYGPGY
jgi:hypothetical protein